MNENENKIDLIYKLNYFPGNAKLIELVQEANPDINKEEITKYDDNDITN